MQHLSILLVDDVELNVVVAKSILEKQGHYVDVAMNGEQAIQLFEKNTYDIVFLDIKMCIRDRSNLIIVGGNSYNQSRGCQCRKY